ncbi:hypothetical protein BH747_03510 [Enterococcus villorum]|uniref:Uncharacterized protein n=2 Tax=Enterococcus villorum TaxID=112904 RepID=A0A1V8YF18_9ENTE|nr:hypothetical protein [Enterococcus villorum]EOH88949.1 hypothetical protein UAO_01681 [Enterococcus villorum ATCC 700913]EOW76216.1 hypothetical protein I591_01518 [Enterococcus villorum ATCC 700913]OQO71237.1 hypothetical protein BH747_03510 [Enterococcus villorum]OQO73931.1 hypothetical protein BH744_07835 [Enterococcus villorum]GEL91270.1 hypothetical protein EVI01_06070 [Enterococcus villorum]
MLFSMFYLLLLGACKQKSNPVVSLEKVDKVVILVKDDEGKEKNWKATDPNFLKTLIGNLNVLFDKSDKNAQRYDMKLTSKQKRFNYQIKFYKNNDIVQDIQISQVNKVTIDKEKFTIGKEKENELDSLKNHLLLVAK